MSLLRMSILNTTRTDRPRMDDSHSKLVFGGLPDPKPCSSGDKRYPSSTSPSRYLKSSEFGGDNSSSYQTFREFGDG